MLAAVNHQLLQLEALWEEVGLSTEDQSDRLREIGLHVAALLDKIVDQEMTARDQIIAAIDEHTDTIQQLSMELEESLTKVLELLRFSFPAAWFDSANVDPCARRHPWLNGRCLCDGQCRCQRPVH